MKLVYNNNISLPMKVLLVAGVVSYFSIINKVYAANGNEEACNDYIITWKDEDGMNAVNRLSESKSTCPGLGSKYKTTCITLCGNSAESLRKNEHIEDIREDKMIQVLGWKVDDADESSSASSLDDDGFLRRRKLNEEFTRNGMYGFMQTKAKELNEHSDAQNLPKTKRTICVVDSGYFDTHEDLPTSDENCAEGTDFNYANLPWDYDANGHGTHVSGTIAMIGYNGKGGIGINPACNNGDGFQIISCPAVDNNGGGRYSWMIEQAALCCNSDGPDERKADVISISLGWPEDYEEVPASRDFILWNLYHSSGSLIIAAAGNSGLNTRSYPAYADGVMAVAAVDINGNRPDWSSSNNQIEIAGSGVGIYSTTTSCRKKGRTTTCEPSYAQYSGTSMAAPHVAGVAALVWSHFPSCTNKQIRQALIQSATRADGAPCDEFTGHGVVDAMAAFNLLLEKGCDGVGQGTDQGGCNQYLYTATNECTANGECDDDNDCTTDVCVSGECQNTLDELLCPPSSQPSFQPTTSYPSIQPSTSQSPTTDQPSISPSQSQSPTTDQPSISPSTEQPSASPSVSQSPTTVQPSISPSTDHPSASPSVSQSPTTNHPSRSPSRSCTTTVENERTCSDMSDCDQNTGAPISGTSCCSCIWAHGVDFGCNKKKPYYFCDGRLE